MQNRDLMDSEKVKKWVFPSDINSLDPDLQRSDDFEFL